MGLAIAGERTVGGGICSICGITIVLFFTFIFNKDPMSGAKLLINAKVSIHRYFSSLSRGVGCEGPDCMLSVLCCETLSRIFLDT